MVTVVKVFVNAFIHILDSLRLQASVKWDQSGLQDHHPSSPMENLMPLQTSVLVVLVPRS